MRSPPSVVSPIPHKHEQLTNDDIFVGKDPLPVPLNSDFVCTTTDPTGGMSRSADSPRTSSLDGVALGEASPSSPPRRTMIPGDFEAKG